jgi:2-desacetyl-2-hydroxyethyl bacteriochlorophyllide A dehydrogenase
VRARALWFVEPRRVEIRPVEADVRDDDLVVRTIASGISAGTELLAYRGGIDPSTPLDETLGALGGTFAFPFRYGYACVGTVESSKAASARPDSTVFAFHPHQDVFSVRPDDAIVVDGVEPRIGTMLPLVETALQICLDAEAQLGARVVVSGLGVVGTLAALLLQRSGADVLGIDPREDRRKLATDLGLAVVEPGEAREAVFDRTDGAGADVVVESSGAGVALASALGLLRHEGTALVASWYGSAPVALPLGGAFHRRRLTIRSTQVSTIPARLSRTWDRRRRLTAARDLLSELPLDALATHAFAFEEAAAAFDALDRGERGLVHAVLEYR